VRQRSGSQKRWPQLKFQFCCQLDCVIRLYLLEFSWKMRLYLSFQICSAIALCVIQEIRDKTNHQETMSRELCSWPVFLSCEAQTQVPFCLCVLGIMFLTGRSQPVGRLGPRNLTTTPSHHQDSRKLQRMNPGLSKAITLAQPPKPLRVGLRVLICSWSPHSLEQ
jgi:hypothetical protein